MTVITKKILKIKKLIIFVMALLAVTIRQSYLKIFSFFFSL
jgi:hypothetical protein